MLATATRPRQQASKSSHLSWEDNIARFRGLKTKFSEQEAEFQRAFSSKDLLELSDNFLFLFAAKFVQIQLEIWNKKSSNSKGFDNSSVFFFWRNCSPLSYIYLH